MPNDDIVTHFSNIWREVRKVHRMYPIVAQTNAIIGHRSSIAVVANVAWLEIGWEVTDYGGQAEAGQLSLTGNQLLIPQDGMYVIVMNVQWPTPAAAYVRVITATDVIGLGAAGTLNSRNDTPSSAIIGLLTNSSPIARYYSAGQKVAGYVYQQSGGAVTIAANNIKFSGYRVG